MSTTTIEVSGAVWIGDAADPMNGPVVLEGEDCAYSVERSDDDEVSLHATLPGDDNAVASFYMNRVAALALAKLIERKALA